MKKIFKKLGLFLKKQLIKLLIFIKNHTFRFVGLILTWVVPIILLNNEFALLKTVNAGVKISAMGGLVAFLLLIKFRKHIFAKIHTIKNKFTQEITKTTYRVINYGVVIGLVWGVRFLSDKLFDWYLLSGITLLLGAVCYMIDAYYHNKRLKRGVEDEKQV